MKISIITACYNSANTIQDTLESVLMQDYDNYEHIIIDGKSKDNTLEIVDKYKKRYKGKLVVVSEKDKGLYDAMNKGISLATGDVIGILNSDDMLANKNVLKDIANSVIDTKCDGVYGDLQFRDKEMKKVVRVWKSKHGSYKFGWHPPHPTLYLKKEVYNNIGTFNMKYKVVADYDFMIRMMKNKTNLFYIKKVLIHMREGGCSTAGLKGYINNFKESYRVLKDNKVHFSLIVNIIRTIKTVWQMIIAKLKR